MLKQNTTILAQYPFRMMGGTFAGERTLWGQSERRNVFAGAFDARSGGMPSGHLAPSSWSLPQSGGGMSAFTSIYGAGTVTGAGAGGKNGAAGLTGAGTITGLGELVVSAIAALVGTGTLTGNALASLNAAAALAGSGDLVGAFEALGFSFANLSGAGSLTITPYAVGSMAANITPFTELSPQNLATAVWGQIIEAGYSADEILRLLAAESAGAATGLEGANPQFKGLDGTTTRIDGTYSAGTRTINSLNPD